MSMLYWLLKKEYYSYYEFYYKIYINKSLNLLFFSSSLKKYNYVFFFFFLILCLKINTLIYKTYPTLERTPPPFYLIRHEPTVEEYH